jgi:hypothetical protein
MKSLFGAQDVLDLVTNGYEDLGANPTEPQRHAFREAKKNDCKTLFYNQQNDDARHFEKISKATKSKEAWDILESYHDGGGKGKTSEASIIQKKV